jgi:hypothetical protein
MRAAGDEEVREPVAQSRGRAVDGEHREGQLPVQAVLAPACVGTQRVAETPLARSTLALVFLWYTEPTMRRLPSPPQPLPATAGPAEGGQGSTAPPA